MGGLIISVRHAKDPAGMLDRDRESSVNPVNNLKIYWRLRVYLIRLYVSCLALSSSNIYIISCPVSNFPTRRSSTKSLVFLAYTTEMLSSVADLIIQVVH